MQSRMDSLIEAGTNTLVGLVFAFGVNMVLMQVTGLAASAGQNVVIVLGHTVVSVARSYCVRRFFNGDWRNMLKFLFKNEGLKCYLQRKFRS